MVVADFVDLHNNSLDALRLNRIELGNNIQVHLPREDHTVAYTGTLVGKRVTLSKGTPTHRLTLWVHSEERIEPNTPNTCLLYTSPSPRDS